jgi:BirA family transcriptional regulator, biotin operon repressor / biotin---[acetyl-CoA-carboxylase] ligase
MTPDPILEALLAAGERIGPMEGRITWVPEATSTNDLAKLMAERGADEGSVIVADTQTAGRGRLGRSWASPAGAGIYASVIFRPAMRVAPLLTIAAGVAIADGIGAATGLDVQLKWPNDLYAGGRKLGGILAEGASHFVVLGFGINVLPAAYPPDVRGRATSIATELGRAADRGLVLAECLAALWARYTDLVEHRDDAVIQAWRARAVSTVGKPIEWERDGIVERGTVRDVDATGALLMATDSGPVIRIVAGEVRWL